MKKIFLLSTAFCCLFAFSCKKEAPEPNAPSYHQDVFHCKVNGQDWSPSGGGGPFGGPSSLHATYYEDNGQFGFLNYRETDDPPVYQVINFVSLNVTAGSSSLIRYGTVFKDRLNTGCVGYQLDTTANHDIFIEEIDRINKTIKGSFQFSAKNNCGEIVMVTEGYFDVAPFWYE